jgi:hypothetical protein
MEGLGATATHASEEVTLLEKAFARKLIPVDLPLADIRADTKPVFELTITVIVPQIPHMTTVNLKR